MRSLVPALLAFAFLLVAQVAVWRIRRPAGQYLVLPALALAVLVGSLGVLYLLQAKVGISGQFLPGSVLDYVNVVMLYSALAMVDFVTYPAVQADSPSLTMVLRIDQAGPKGLALEDLLGELNDRVLVMPRLDDLLAARMVRVNGGRYVVNPSGAVLARVHMSYRALLKMGKGG